MPLWCKPAREGKAPHPAFRAPVRGLRRVQGHLTRDRVGLEVLVQTRRASAAMLRDAFAGDAELAAVAGALDRSADAAEKVVSDGTGRVADASESSRIAAGLRELAAAERAAAELLIARGARPEPDPSPERFRPHAPGDMRVGH